MIKLKASGIITGSLFLSFFISKMYQYIISRLDTLAKSSYLFVIYDLSEISFQGSAAYKTTIDIILNK